MLKTANIFMTGGAGTLGRAIAQRRKRDGWTGKLTVYSTDSHKHQLMKRLYPDVNYIQGDIRNPETLYNGMVGHDVCLHLAAVKVIPVSEFYSIDTIDVNINGSLNVCVQAISAGIKHVLGISTDKACHPANLYGATKMAMEKIFQEYARLSWQEWETQFHLVRYGNVLESTGSVIEAWHNSMNAGEPIKVTDSQMTRFWLSPQQAVDLVIKSLELPSGQIYIPKIKSLSIENLAEYTVSATIWENADIKVAFVPIRPGEKRHECLLTIEEAKGALYFPDHFVIQPSTSEAFPYHLFETKEYTSDIAEKLTKDELMELLRNE